MTFAIYIHVEEVDEKKTRWPYDECHNLQHLQSFRKQNDSWSLKTMRFCKNGHKYNEMEKRSLCKNDHEYDKSLPKNKLKTIETRKKTRKQIQRKERREGKKLTFNDNQLDDNGVFQ
jgi:hypothetical protein